MSLRIDDYDSSVGTTLWQYAKLYVESAVRDFLRKCCGTVSTSEHDFRMLHQISAICRDGGNKSEEEQINEAVKVTGLTDDKIRTRLPEYEDFRYPKSLQTKKNTIIPEARNHNSYAPPDKMVIRQARYYAIIAELEKLRHKDYSLLMDYLGIDCPYCGQVYTPPQLSDIADKHQLRDEQSVTNRFRKIAEKLRDELRKQGWE